MSYFQIIMPEKWGKFIKKGSIYYRDMWVVRKALILYQVYHIFASTMCKKEIEKSSQSSLYGILKAFKIDT